MTNKQSSDRTIQNKDIKTAWGYTESFFVAFEIMIIGFVIEIFLKGGGVKSPHLPYNIYLLLALTGILIFIHFKYRSKRIIRWLSSVPCSVSAISVYALLVLLLGFIPQQAWENQSKWLQILGLNHIKNSWPFLLIQLYLIISLGLVVLRRGFPFKLKNLGFLMNHLGLWITLVAAGLGSGDLKRVKINIFENEDFNRIGTLADQSMFELPFAIKLLDFNIEMYNPKIAIADRFKGEILEKHGETLPIIHKGYEAELFDWKIKINEYLPDAIKTDSGYAKMDKPGSMAAAFVETKNTITGDTISGWITSGSLMFNPGYLNLNRSKLLLLTQPEPKRFESLVVIKNTQGLTDTITLEVNKSFNYNGWKLYQIGYDTKMGKYSKLSVIDAVKDPWRPLVYTGILLLLAGAIYLFWIGKEIRSE